MQTKVTTPILYKLIANLRFLFRISKFWAVFLAYFRILLYGCAFKGVMLAVFLLWTDRCGA